MYIYIKPDVDLTDKQRERVASLEKYFAEANLQVTLTSGRRTQWGQIAVIRKLALDAGIQSDAFYTDFLKERFVSDMIRWDDVQGQRLVYWWAPVWSKCLNLGLIVNPPIKALCLEHSFRNDGTDRYMDIIAASPHLDPRGTCIDLSAGKDYSPNNELAVLNIARQYTSCAILNIVVERKQNCIHVDFKQPYV
jgi:hypothetical protein